VWHFACHCYARPDRILDSALILDGGELTLRAILALPPAPRRLAVLSACGTHRSGTDLPDEVTGLPTALIQAGFAGVVASHWPVNDWSTAHLMTRFHDLWHNHGMPPAAALAAAQGWFRTATHADLRAYSSQQRGDTQLPAEPERQDGRPFRHPFYWAPFALTGH
jgi:CHAT domain-containing protein